MSEQITEERLRNTRAWAAARIGSMSGAEVIVGAIDELIAARESIARYESGRVVLTGMVDDLKLKLQQVTLERDAMLERVAETQPKEGHLTIKNCTFEPPGAECAHGQLARQCPLCEKDARITEIEQQLAMANDAAAKGDLARANAGGMELQIEEMRLALRDLWRLEGEPCPKELDIRVKGLIGEG